jgi:hypothetical protein
MLHNNQDFELKLSCKYPSEPKFSLTNEQQELHKEMLIKADFDYEYEDESNDIGSEQIQSIIQLQLIVKAKCSYLDPEIIQSFSLTNYHFDESKIMNLLNSISTLNVNLHKHIACVIQSYSSGGHKNIRKLFKFLDKIPVESGEGSLYRVSSNSDVKPYIIKTVNDLNENDVLIHEAMIGFYAINKLRKYVPNFVHTYDYFACSEMISDKNTGDIITWCTQPSATSYLVLENIINSMTLLDFIKKIILSDKAEDIEIFDNIFIQILNALSVAHAQYNFTHYDLHSENIMVREFENHVTIKIYDEPDKLISRSYIKSTYLIYILDFGYSHIKINDYAFGRFWMEEFDIYQDRAEPMRDLKKLYLNIFSELTFRVIGSNVDHIKEPYKTNVGKYIKRTLAKLYNHVVKLDATISYGEYKHMAINQGFYTNVNYFHGNLENYDEPISSCQFSKLVSDTTRRIKDDYHLCSLYHNLQKTDITPHEKERYLEFIRYNYQKLEDTELEFNRIKSRMNYLENLDSFRILQTDYQVNFKNRDELFDSLYTLMHFKDSLFELESLIDAHECVLNIFNLLKDDLINKSSILLEETSNIYHDIVSKLKGIGFKNNQYVDDEIKDFIDKL